MSEDKRICPGYGAPLEGDSLVCAACGHAVRSESDGIDPFERMVDGIEDALAELKGKLRRGVFPALKARAWFILPLLMLLMLAVALSPNTPERYGVTALALGIFPLMAPLILLVYLRVKRGRGPASSARLLRRRIAEQLVTARKHYGEDTEVKRLLAEYEAEVALIDRARRQDHLNGAIGFALVAFLFVFSLWLVPPYTVSFFERALEDVSELQIAATPLRQEINGPLATYLRLADQTVAVRHVVYRGAGRLDIEALVGFRVVRKWLGTTDPAMKSADFSLSLYVLDANGMSLYQAPLQESYSDYDWNPLLNGWTEFNARLTASMNESDFTPGEWLAVAETLERAGKYQWRFVVASAPTPTIEQPQANDAGTAAAR